MRNLHLQIMAYFSYVYAAKNFRFYIGYYYPIMCVT